MALASLKRRLRDEDGGATVELVLVLPVFLLIVGLIVDASMIFYRQSQTFRIVQDANRSLSIGRLASPEETAALVLSQLAPITAGASAISTVTDGIVTTRVALPVSDIQITGLLTAFQGGTIGVTASHVVER